MIAAALLFTLMQAAPAAPAGEGAIAAAPVRVERTVAQDRLAVCLRRARIDPATAMAEAGRWAVEAQGAETAYPQQCLGLAYTSLLRWKAAEQAFVAARDATDPADRFRRAQLGTMAGNAALAEGRAADALVVLDVAAADAAATADAGLRALIEIDRARAQVLQGHEPLAESTLAAARAFDARSHAAWLLSATLARRQGKLEEARAHIETAAALGPENPETLLEAGVIAMLSGNEALAANHWVSVMEHAPSSEEAATARAYLAQLAQPAENPESAR